MANLDNLIGKILEDAKVKADEIIKNAETEAQEKISLAQRESVKKRDMILNRAKTESQLIEERIQSGTELKIRDDSLKAKGNVIDKTMGVIKEKLRNLTPDEFSKYVENTIGNRQIGKDEIIKVSEKYLEEAKKKFPDSKVETVKDISGFLIEKNGVIENHSFDTLIDYMKEDLEAEAAKLLFKD